MSDLRHIFEVFYTTPRVAAQLLSDGGGPFGFDIQIACQFDHLVEVYQPDGIIETGCAFGDTTAYLARAYPNVAISSCELIPERADFTRERLRSAGNVRVIQGNSTSLLAQMHNHLKKPIYYFDAHSSDLEWPLPTELMLASRRGIVVVHDFDIGHARFGFDSYGSDACAPELIARVRPDLSAIWVGNPYGTYPFPCLQVQRRTGVAYVLPNDITLDSSMFLGVPLKPHIVLPDWPNNHSRAHR